MKRIIGTLFLFVILGPAPCAAWNAEVTRVHDGDSLTVVNEDGRQVKIRLQGVDCPESWGKIWKPQPYSRRATNLVKDILPRGSKVAIVDMGEDAYGRTVAGVVRLPDGLVVEEELLRQGLVMVYEKYCENCPYYQALQAEAKENRRGQWAWPGGPTPPWVFRAEAREAAKREAENNETPR